MNCVNCHHENESHAKFCGKCGTNLLDGTSSVMKEIAATTSVSHARSQQYVEKGKIISKLYFSYLLTILKKPVTTAKNIDRKELVNGLITIVLFALIIPLMTFLGLKGAFEDSYFQIDISIADVVIKPFIVLFVFLAVTSLILFGAVKLGKSHASFTDVLSRMGAFLVVPTALLVVALLISVVGSAYFIIFLVLGLLGASFTIPLMVYSFKGNDSKGLDLYYCIFLTYIGIIIVFAIIGDRAFQEIEEMISYMNPFGF